MTAMTKLSKRYYHAWKVTKTYRFLFGLDEFLAKEHDSDIIEFSVSEVDELSDMCEASLNRLPNSRMSIGETGLDEQQNELQQNQYKTNIQSPNLNNDGDGIHNMQVKSSIPLTPGMAVGSLNSLNFEDMEFINNSEIDRLWMLMVSMKNDANTSPEINNDLGDQILDLHPLQTTGNSLNSRTPFSGNDLNENSLDLLRDRHLDQIFDGNY